MVEWVLQFMQIVGGCALLGLALWPLVLLVRKVTKGVQDRKTERSRLSLQVARLSAANEARDKEFDRWAIRVESQKDDIARLEATVKKLEQRWEQPKGTLE